MHRFRDNDVFCQPEMTSWWFFRYRAPYDVFDDEIWKGDPKFIFMLYWHILSIFNRLRVMRLFHFGWDFNTTRQICGGFGGKWPQKVKISKNTCIKRLPYVKPRLLSYRAWNSVHGYWLYAWLGMKKTKKAKIKCTRPRYFTTTWGRHR